MKKIIIIVAVCLCVVIGTAIFILTTNTDTELTVVEESLPTTVLFSELRTRPDIILNSYMEAYPDIIISVFEKEGEWVMEMHDGTFIYWAEGRLLPEDKKNKWEEYRAQHFYPNYGTVRDPSAYTEEDLQRLRNYTSDRVRSAPNLPQDTTLRSYTLAVGNREQTEASLVTDTLFGYTIQVNKEAAKQLDSITKAVTELSKTDSEVFVFLEDIGDVSCFNWRVIAGTDRLSNHSYGIAIDILPVNSGRYMIYWAWVRNSNEDWMLVPQEDLWQPPQKVVDIFYDHGFMWGGTWPMYDNMHFEYRPESIKLAKYVIMDHY